MTARKPVVPATSEPVVEVFDLDAAVAQRHEASKANSFDFKYEGERYSMPLDLKLSAVRKLNNLDENNWEAIFNAILGDDAEKLFKADPTTSTLVTLMDAYQKAVGGSLGKDSTSND